MHTEKTPRIYDCIVIGGGAAGLCAATYLARYRRDILVIDAGESRLQRIPLARNVPSYPDGIAGPELLLRLTRQAERYGVPFLPAKVTSLEFAAQGFRVLAEQTHLARTVLLATGVELVEPYVQGIDRAVREGLIRYCPICDGFETAGMNVAVFGVRNLALKEAGFLRRFTDRVTVLCEADDGGSPEIAEPDGVRVVNAPVRSLGAAARSIKVTFTSGEVLTFDALYPSLGCEPRSGLLRPLDGDVSSSGGILTDEHQRTTVPGVYAAGDVLEGLDQIASAFGQAAIAATTIHNDLLKEPLSRSMSAHA